MVEAYNDFCKSPNRLRKINTINERDIHRLRKRNAPTEPTKMDIPKKPLDYFWKHFPVPIDKATNQAAWLYNNHLIKYNNSKQQFKDDVHLFNRQLSLLSLELLYNELINAEPLFAARIKLEDTYDDREISTINLNNFLDYQLGEDKFNFVSFLYDLLNKQSGKKNCLNIVGPPSSGKTMFARLIKEALITSGQIANMNRNTQFPFNNCINKRVLHWDEPSFNPESLEDLKMLFSGDELSVNVKYESYNSLTRTPVIVTSNLNVFPRDEAFNCRIQHYKFKTYNDYVSNKSLHPLSLYDIFMQFDLMK